MSDVITTRKISRLEVIETLPPEVRDRARSTGEPSQLFSIAKTLKPRASGRSSRG